MDSDIISYKKKLVFLSTKQQKININLRVFFFTVCVLCSRKMFQIIFYFAIGLYSAEEFSV